MFVVAGTGHRPDKLGGYDDEAADTVFGFACYALDEMKPDLVISGMALGWDLALAEAAIDLDIDFKAYVPFKGQESKWPYESQLHYHSILKKAKEVVYCSPPGYSAVKMQIRNKRMVDDCNHLIAMWDGSSGGTKNCLAYARSKSKPVTNYWFLFQQGL